MNSAGPFAQSLVILTLSYSPRRRSNRRTIHGNRFPPSRVLTSNPSELQFTIDVQHLRSKVSLSLRRTLSSCHSKLDKILSSGAEAYRDLQNLVAIDSTSKGITVSCRKSTVQFVGGFLLWSCVIVVAVRVLYNLGLGIWGGTHIREMEMVRRRDRSLGGREVVVGWKTEERRRRKGDPGTAQRVWELGQRNLIQWQDKRLPQWWPAVVSTPVLAANREECLIEANRLIRAIMDDRVRGKDISEDDILELRRICRKSGAKVSIEMENARDSFYRFSVDFVIKTSCRARTLHPQIDGEDARLFIAGLADNLGLSSIRAATIVSATVAARTRLWFLQAWALEMQGKHSDAEEELLKICLTHQLFPPELSSPEMEMVARGLEKHLKLEQRKFLLNTLVRVCGEENQRSAAEALGLAGS